MNKTIYNVGKVLNNKEEVVDEVYYKYNVVALNAGLTKHKGDIKFYISADVIKRSIDKWNGIKCFNSHRNEYDKSAYSVANILGYFTDAKWSDEYEGIIGTLYLLKCDKNCQKVSEIIKDGNNIQNMICLSSAINVEYDTDNISEVKEKDNTYYIVPVTEISDVLSLDLITGNDGATDARFIISNINVGDYYIRKPGGKSNMVNKSIANFCAVNNVLYKDISDVLIATNYKVETEDEVIPESILNMALILSKKTNTEETIENADSSTKSKAVESNVTSNNAFVKKDNLESIYDSVYKTMAEASLQSIIDSPNAKPENRSEALRIKQALNNVSKFTSFRTMYKYVCGHSFDDHGFEPFSAIRNAKQLNQFNDLITDKLNNTSIKPVYRLENADVSISTFVIGFGNLMNRILLDLYPLQALNNEVYDICTINYVSDFRQQNRIRIGGFDTLFDVDERDAYQDLGNQTEEVATYTAKKRGGTVSLSWEAMVNDDIGYVSRLPLYIMRACARRLYNFVFNDELDSNGNGGIFRNPLTYGSVRLFGTNNINGTTTNWLGNGLEPSAETVAAARMRMRQLPELDTTSPLGIVPRYVMGVFENEDALYSALNSLIINTTDGAGNVSLPGQMNPYAFVSQVSKYGLQLKTNQLLNSYTVSNQYPIVFFSDKNDLSPYELGFLGTDVPYIAVQDINNSVSAFFQDVIYWKVRHTYSGTVLDRRAMIGANIVQP